MVGSKAKKQAPYKPRRPRPGSKSEAILTLTACTPARPAEIAETVDCDKALVSRVMERYGIIPNTAESYKKHRADILAGVQERILATVNEEDIKSASVLQRVTSFGILYDKERLERGQASQIIGHGIALSPSLQESVDKLISRVMPVDK